MAITTPARPQAGPSGASSLAWPAGGVRPEGLAAAPAVVSVVIPTRDRPALLAQALASVARLAGDDLTLDIIVADNSRTGSARKVAEDAGVRYAIAKAHGPAAARNAGLRQARGEFVAFLDDDDVWLDGHLRAQVAQLRAYPALLASIGQVVNADASLRPEGEPWPRLVAPRGDRFSAFLREYPQIGATVVRASAIRRVGLLDETLIADEDWEWHVRLAAAGPIGFVAVPSVLFRQRPAGRQNDDQEWRRLGFHAAAFRRIAVRHVVCRPSAVLGAVPHFVRQRGAYAAYFAVSARTHWAQGERGRAVLALGRSLFASPLHACRAFMMSQAKAAGIALALLHQGQGFAL